MFGGFTGGTGLDDADLLSSLFSFDPETNELALCEVNDEDGSIADLLPRALHHAVVRDSNLILVGGYSPESFEVVRPFT